MFAQHFSIVSYPFETSKCAEKNGVFLLMSTYFFIINGRNCHKTTPESTKKPQRIIIRINHVIDFNLRKTEISGFLFQNHIVYYGENEPNE